MTKRKSPKRSREDRYAHLKEPEAELDFHAGRPLDGAEIKRRTLEFVEDARRRGLKRLRIVTGKGIHSREGAVARPQVVRTLAALEESGAIGRFEPEKLSAGGEGAFRVVL